MSKKWCESAVIIDLEVDRSLLNPNFDCYRVSIDPIVSYKQSFTGCVNELRLNDEEYSYLHISMASQFNHLFSDPYFPQTVYFVTNLGQIIWVSIELVSGNLTKPTIVYSIPDFESSFTSISFPNNELSLLSNSSHKNPAVYLMSTPSRAASEPWILLSTIGLSDYKMQNKFHLWDSNSIDLYNNCSQIDFILCFVDKTNQNQNITESVTKSTESSFICVINWFTIIGNPNEANSWSVKRLRTMNGKDWPKYLAFDFIGTPLLCLVSKKDFTFIHDSEKPIVEQNSEPLTKSEPKPVYTYCQTLEDICVNFKLPVHLSKNDISIDLKSNTISVKIKDIIEFEGKLFDTIEANSSVWTLLSEKDFQLLEITVNKSEKGNIWKEFIKGDKTGVEILNNEMTEEIQQKLSHLTQEMPEMDTDDNRYAYDPIGLEECDYTTDSLVFNRHNGNNHSIVHRIDLTGSQWLFTIPVQKSSVVDSNELPYFVIRHDVDAVVWAPQSSPDITHFKADHLATFSAIGYVQASKINTRFIVGSNDFNFVAIADGLRHVYIYRQPISLKSEIRNRKTGQEVQTVAKQHVINLNDCQYIIGIQAINDHIFVLSNDKIFLIKL